MSALNILEVSTIDAHVTNRNDVVSTYKLPTRQNCGVPPDRFSPEEKSEVSNNQLWKKLSLERQAWVNNVEIIQVPT